MDVIDEGKVNRHVAVTSESRSQCAVNIKRALLDKNNKLRDILFKEL